MNFFCFFSCFRFSIRGIFGSTEGNGIRSRDPQTERVDKNLNSRSTGQRLGPASLDWVIRQTRATYRQQRLFRNMQDREMEYYRIASQNPQ